MKPLTELLAEALSLPCLDGLPCVTQDGTGLWCPNCIDLGGALRALSDNPQAVLAFLAESGKVELRSCGCGHGDLEGYVLTEDE